MKLKIGQRALEEYNGVNVSLRYDSIASGFSFDFFFDPENPDHRAMFRPCSYQPVTITHEEETLITGTVLSQGFTSRETRVPMAVGGYSKTGVLEDCSIPLSAYPLQSNKLTLRQIASKILKPFGLKLVVDSSVQSLVDKAYPVSAASDSQTCQQYLAELCGQRHIILTHNELGDIVMTRARVGALPIHHFDVGQPGIKMDLDINGQNMHSEITMIKQQTKGRKDGTHKKGNAGQSSVKNPYAAGQLRPRVNRQTSGEVVDTSNAARNMLSEEIASIVLKIEVEGWKLSGRIVRPNNEITVTNPDLYLFSKSRWFIAQVDFSGDNNSETCLLTCVPSDVFSGGTPKNIFA